jgi:hypothetical protein
MYVSLSRELSVDTTARIRSALVLDLGLYFRLRDLKDCVRLTFLGNVDDQQLKRLGPDGSTPMPLPHRFHNEISWFVGTALARSRCWSR